jgi:hypothetical protein
MSTSSSVRFVVCLTTIPSRLHNVLGTLTLLLDQTRLPDAVYLTVPMLSKRGKAFLPVDLDALEHFAATHPNGARLQILRPDIDLGPIMKCMAVLAVETNPLTQILIVDDDRWIHPDCVGMFERYRKQIPCGALSLSGWCVGSTFSKLQFVTNPTSAVRVDWIQGTDGILFSRSALDETVLRNYDAMNDATMRDYMMWNDDHWLAHCFHLAHVDRVVLPVSKDMYFRPLPHRHTDSISGRGLQFVKEVVAICKYQQDQRVYFHHYSVTNSMFLGYLGLAISVLLLLCAMIFLYTMGRTSHGQTRAVQTTLLAGLIGAVSYTVLEPQLKDW